jgi:hypothetical protein
MRMRAHPQRVAPTAGNITGLCPICSDGTILTAGPVTAQLSTLTVRIKEQGATKQVERGKDKAFKSGLRSACVGVA